ATAVTAHPQSTGSVSVIAQRDGSASRAVQVDQGRAVGVRGPDGFTLPVAREGPRAFRASAGVLPLVRDGIAPRASALQQHRPRTPPARIGVANPQTAVAPWWREQALTKARGARAANRAASFAPAPHRKGSAAWKR